jgi:S-adenosylmethionine hydrolase
VELTNPGYWRTPTPSFTFHGRDIFAPVAAHLASGTPIEHLGTILPVDHLVQLAIPSCQPMPGGEWCGCIQAIDGFGNLITNFPQSLVKDTHWWLVVAKQRLLGQQTYSEVAVGTAIALVGSHGWLEVAVNGGNAQQVLNQRLGDQVTLWLQVP